MKKKIDGFNFSILGGAKVRVTVARDGYLQSGVYFPAHDRLSALQKTLQKKVRDGELFASTPYFDSWGYCSYDIYTRKEYREAK